VLTAGTVLEIHAGTQGVHFSQWQDAERIIVVAVKRSSLSAGVKSIAKAA